MKNQRPSALAIGIGAVAGLRPMTAYAVIALALERGWIRPWNSPLAGIVSGSASKRITELAMAELIADKLPFTPSRLKVVPLVSRAVSGAICGAAIHSARKRMLSTGALVGGLAAIGAAVAAYQARRRLSRDLPDFVVALLEDALAAGGGLVIAALAATLD
jgi:uncharacterized membrane protein